MGASRENIDTLRMVFSYVIALVVVLGGGLYIFWHGTNTNAASTLVVVAGFMGSALTFVFGLEVQTRTARQSETQAASSSMHTAAAIATQNGHDKPLDTEDAGGVA